MQEIFMDGGLVPRGIWESRIDSIRAGVGLELQDREAIKERLKDCLKDAVTRRVPTGRFGILFSGGLDSAIIAFLLKDLDPVCYTFGYAGKQEPEDVKVALDAAKDLGLNVKVRLVDLDEARVLIERTAMLLGKELATPVNTAIAAVELACIEMAKEDGIGYLFGGLGSEEIFAGYHRHRLASDVQEECWRGLREMHSKDLVRDCILASKTGVELATPFLDEKMISLAMQVPGSMKVDSKFTKVILREVCEGLGLPPSLAWRPKKAAQYGSRIERALDRLAKGRQNDYLKSMF